MEPTVPIKKLEPGVYQGSPEIPDAKKVAPARLIRTMKLDMAEAIKNQKETSVSIAIAEQKKVAQMQTDMLSANQVSTEKAPTAPKPIGRVVVVIIILLVGGLLGFAYVFLLPKLGSIKLPTLSIPSFGAPADTAPVATTTEVISLAPSLIPAQSEKRFDIKNETKNQILAAVTEAKKEALTAGGIKNLYFTEGTTALSANRLFMFAEISAPEILVRSLERSFMAGFIGGENNESVPFTILKVSGSDTGLAGMLEWESTLPRFFDTMFGTSVEGGVMTTTKFRDTVVSGKDARVLNTTFGATIAYAFANNNTIVITGSVSTLNALLPLAARN